MKNKRVIINCLVLLLVFLAGCTQNKSTIKLTGIEVQKSDSSSGYFKPYKTISSKEDIKIIKKITEKLDKQDINDIALVAPIEYQFNFTLDTKNADNKPVVYQLQRVTGDEVFRMNNLDLSLEDSRTLQKILIAK